MTRSWAYNRFGVLMGASWRASGPRWPSLRGGVLPMITLFPSQGDFCATASNQWPDGPCQMWVTDAEPVRGLRRPTAWDRAVHYEASVINAWWRLLDCQRSVPIGPDRLFGAQ